MEKMSLMMEIEAQFKAKNQVATREQRPLYVMKFGGTSVGSAQAIESAVGIVSSNFKEGKSIVMVVSAMSGITNRLVSICESIATSNPENRDMLFRNVLDSHLTTVSEMRLQPQRRVILQERLRKIFMDLREDVYEDEELSDERKAKILAYGERLSSRLVSAKLEEKGLKSVSIDAFDVISTNDDFTDAIPDLEKTKVKAQSSLLPLIYQDYIPVVTGFFGGTDNGKIATFSRGGSDYSASIIGRSIGGDEVWIWTDVDGMYTDDPRKNPDAKIIPELSINDADRMAKAGAKVLHPRTLEPLFGSRTNLRIKNTFNPDFPGTLIKSLD